MPDASDQAGKRGIETSDLVAALAAGGNADNIGRLYDVGCRKLGVAADVELMVLFLDKAMQDETVVQVGENDVAKGRLSGAQWADLDMITVTQPRRHAGALGVDDDGCFLLQECGHDRLEMCPLVR